MIRYSVRWVVETFAWLAVCTYANATLLDALSLLAPGDRYRVLFVTETQVNALSRDISFYDSVVQSEAAAGSVTSGLGLSWTALVSTTNSVASPDRAQPHTGIFASDASPVRFFTTAGDLVATSGADLWDGTLNRPIYLTADGAEPLVESLPLHYFVWTGTNQFGDPLSPLGQEFSTNTYGVYLTTTRRWMLESPVGDADLELRLYGVSSEGSIPVTTVPEPGTWGLLGIGILMVGALRRVKFARFARKIHVVA